MAQIRGTAGYNLGSQGSFSGGSQSRNDATSDPSPLEMIRDQTSKIEEWLDTAADPVKPYVPSYERPVEGIKGHRDRLKLPPGRE